MKLAVIVGSTRPGRSSDRLAKWAFNEAKQVEGVDVTMLDLIDYPLEMFNEAVSPRYNPSRVTSVEVKTWLDALHDADAYLIVTPEYNHSIPAVLKNALDYTDWQMVKKPFAIASHGSVGGARAAEHLKGIISEIQGVALPKNLAFTGWVSKAFDEEGNLDVTMAADPQGPAAQLKGVLEDLKWYSDALSAARQ